MAKKKKTRKTKRIVGATAKAATTKTGRKTRKMKAKPVIEAGSRKGASAKAPRKAKKGAAAGGKKARGGRGKRKAAEANL